MNLSCVRRLIHIFDTNITCVTCLTYRWQMTHSYMWHPSFKCVTCLTYRWQMTHSYMWHPSFTGAKHKTYSYVQCDSIKRRIHICDVTHSHVWRDSFTRVTWLIHTCDVTHSHVWRDSRVTWLIHTWHMTHSHVRTSREAERGGERAGGGAGWRTRRTRTHRQVEEMGGGGGANCANSHQTMVWFDLDNIHANSGVIYIYIHAKMYIIFSQMVVGCGCCIGTNTHACVTFRWQDLFLWVTWCVIRDMLDSYVPRDSFIRVTSHIYM